MGEAGWKNSVFILVANIIYITIGTFVFIHIESADEEAHRAKDILEKEHLMTHLTLQQQEHLLPRILELQKDWCKKGNDISAEKGWDFAGTATYCISILSTIGYGVMSPHGTLSRALTMVYALFGIPIYTVYLSYSSRFVNGLLTKLTRCICLGVSKVPSLVRARKIIGVRFSKSLSKAINRVELRDCEIEFNISPVPSEDLINPVKTSTKSFLGDDLAQQRPQQRPQQRRTYCSSPMMSRSRDAKLVLYQPKESKENVKPYTNSSQDDLPKHRPAFCPSPMMSRPRNGSLNLTEPPQATDQATSFYPSPFSQLLLLLLMALAILTLYITLLILICPVPPGETLTSEVYWTVMRFTTVGFGDEYRDVTRSPEQLPGLLNMGLVCMVYLPLGISICSHLFYVWRKVVADRLRWVTDRNKL